MNATVSSNPDEPTDLLEPIHYGSVYTMADYKTNATNLYLSLNGSLSPRFGVHSTLGYTMAEAKYDQVDMPDPSDRTVTTDGQQEMENANYDFTNMHTYSDLDYGILRLSAGVSFKIQPDLTWTADIDYADLTDDGIWVYGDESGSIYVLRTGLQFDF